MRKQSIAITLSAATLLLSGCTVGPKYKRPTIDTPTVYRSTEASGNTQTSEMPHDMKGNPLPGQATTPASTAISLGDEKWWEVFGDPELQNLIRAALKQNYDVRIAAERVLEAQAQLGITRSQQFPQLNGNGGYTAQRYPSAQFGGLGSFVSHISQIGTSASWNIDFWGQYRNATKAARAQLLASKWSQREVMDTLILNVATGYFELRTLDLELEISKRTLASRQESLQLTQTLESGGSTSMLDVRQAEELVNTAAAADSGLRATDHAGGECAADLVRPESRPCRSWSAHRSAAAYAGCSCRATLYADRAAAGYPPGRRAIDRGECPDRRGQGAVFSGHLSDRAGGHGQQRAEHAFSRFLIRL